MISNLDDLDWAKGDGLLPAIVQHWQTGEVLMLGYMNAEALEETRRGGHVTFYSRSKQRLWTKGESSGHVLVLKSLHADCDRDSLLVLADPHGPTCHRGTASCFDGAQRARPLLAFLGELDALVRQRHDERPAGSYTTSLFDGGMKAMAQKVGEEGVETAIAALAEDDDALLGEAADLVFHLTVLLRARGLGLEAVARKLTERHATKKAGTDA